MLALSTVTMTWIIGVCVAIYLGAIVYAVAAPSKQHDPHRGVAVGCLSIAAIPAVVLAVLLAIGSSAGSERMIRVLFYVTVIPAGYVLAMLIAQPIIMWHKKRNAWVPTDQDLPATTESPTTTQTPEPPPGDKT